MKPKFPKLVVAGLIEKDGKFLLVKEPLESGRDVWLIPGGKVEFGESLEQAVLREIKEELGIDTKIDKYINFKEAIFPDFGYHTVIFFYSLIPLGEKLLLEEKIIDAKYFSKRQLKNLELIDSADWLLKQLNLLPH